MNWSAGDDFREEDAEWQSAPPSDILSSPQRQGGTVTCKHCGEQLWANNGLLCPPHEYEFVHADRNPFCDHSTLSAPVIGEAADRV